jgi:hypothetical protein
MKLIDLTRLLDPNDINLLPENLRASAQVMVPQIDYIHPKSGGIDAMCRAFGCEAHDLPNNEGWGAENSRTSVPTSMHRYITARLAKANRRARLPICNCKNSIATD